MIPPNRIATGKARSKIGLIKTNIIIITFTAGSYKHYTNPGKHATQPWDSSSNDRRELEQMCRNSSLCQLYCKPDIVICALTVVSKVNLLWPVLLIIRDLRYTTLTGRCVAPPLSPRYLPVSEFPTRCQDYSRGGRKVHSL